MKPDALRFIPIPTTPQHIRAWSRYWLPFLPLIAKRSKESIDQLIDRIITGYTQIALVWDGKEAHALIGMQYTRRGEDLVAEIVWLTGRGMKDWTHLLPVMECYLKEKAHCTVIRPICRPGWSRLLKQHGYKTTHIVMEHTL